MERCFADNSNCWVLDSSGNWSRLSPEERRNVQEELRERHLALAMTAPPQMSS